MASVSGMNSSNMSSLYGNRNVLSGLATGMDTEAMIENSVSGIRYKMSALQQKQTKTLWKQDAYRGISDTLVQFSRKYSSYTSATNLSSSSFFNKSVLTTTGGANASKVSATGRSTSDFRLNGVAQLATSGRYQVNGGGVLDGIDSSIQAGEAIDLSGGTTTSNLTGSLLLKYSTQSVILDFKEGDTLGTPEEFLAAVNAKLAEQDVTLSGDGGTKKASELINAELDADGKLTFSDKGSAGNEVYIDGATGKLGKTFKDLDFNDKDNRVHTLDFTGKDLSDTVTMMEKIGGKTMTFTLDGVTKKITLPTKEELDAYTTDKIWNPAFQSDDAYVELLRDKLNSAFGANKITVEDKGSDDSVNGNSLKLSFTVPKGSSLSITSEVNEALGLKNTETTYLNTGKTLGDLLGDNLGGLVDITKPLMGDGIDFAAGKKPIEQKDKTFRDYSGNVVNAAGERLGKDKEVLYGVELKMNGEAIGTFHRDSELSSVMLAINSNTEAGLSVTYSKITNQFVFNAKETGSGYGISFGDGDSTTQDLAEKIFGEFKDPATSSYVAGKDAIVNMTINGEDVTVTRSTNTFDVDGMSVTVNSTFNGSMAKTNVLDSSGNPIPILDKDGNPVKDADGNPVYQQKDVPQFDFLNPDGTVNEANLKDPVTFSSAADADKIVDAIKEMVKDFNAIVTATREAYNTPPAKKNKNVGYEPLTDADREGMSESAIKAYEEKAKQGILFGDRDLSSMYEKLISAIAPPGADGVAMRSIGISTNFSNGISTIDLDEDKLRDMLKTNPDTVRDVFTKEAGAGSGTDGLMKTLKTTLDAYAATEGTKGILINKAGSKYSALSLLKNTMKDELETYDKQMDKLQDTLASKVDYFTRQFTRLEQLTAQMNSQSQSLMGMMGGQG